MSICSTSRASWTRLSGDTRETCAQRNDTLRRTPFLPPSPCQFQPLSLRLFAQRTSAVPANCPWRS